MMEYGCWKHFVTTAAARQVLLCSWSILLGQHVQNQFDYHTLVLLYKIRNGLAPKYLQPGVPNNSNLATTLTPFFSRSTDAVEQLIRRCAESKINFII